MSSSGEGWAQAPQAYLKSTAFLTNPPQEIELHPPPPNASAMRLPPRHLPFPPRCHHKCPQHLPVRKASLSSSHSAGGCWHGDGNAHPWAQRPPTQRPLQPSWACLFPRGGPAWVGLRQAEHVLGAIAIEDQAHLKDVTNQTPALESR